MPALRRCTVLVTMVLAIVLSPATQSSQPLAANRLNVAYFHFPPFLIVGDEPSGFIIDIHREIYEKAGYQLNFIPYPYARALEETSRGIVDFCASLVPHAVVGLRYPQHEVAQLEQVFVVRRGNPWRFTTIHSLQGKTIGNIRHYNYSSISSEYNDFLNSNKAFVHTVTGEDATLRLLRMIAFGRLDTFNESKHLVEYLVAQNDLQNTFEFAGNLGELLLTKPGYPADKPNSEALVLLFDEGIQMLRESGKLDTIMKHYGLNAW